MAAGPSSSAGPDKLQLAEADEKYEAGMAGLRANDLDRAVELLGAALQTRIQAHGDLAPECASAYHHYGTAIFYKAQEEQDVFGAPLQQAAEEQEDNGEERDKGEIARQDANKENVDEKGKGPLRAEDADADAIEETDEPDDDEDEDDAKEGDAGDMQLAWEMLEVARSIYSKMGNAKALALADVYVLLGDIGMEEERFDSSATDYESALKLLMEHLGGDDRRIAEAHYKLALALHFLEDPERALEHANKAVAVCNARITRLSPPQGDGPSSTEPSPEAEKETGDLQAVLEDLAAKVEDLEAAVKEKEATRKALRDAFSQVAGSFAGGAAGSGQSKAAQPPSAPSASAVVNLGVVGRGSKRINMQPLAANAQAANDAGGAAAEPNQKPKRSFEDIMGGGATTSLGFGSPVMVPQGFGAPAGSMFPPAAAAAAGDAPMMKKPKAGKAQGAPAAVPAGIACAAGGSAAPAPSSVPAFLQAGQVARTYGHQATQPPTTEGS